VHILFPSRIIETKATALHRCDYLPAEASASISAIIHPASFLKTLRSLLPEVFFFLFFGHMVCFAKTVGER
jgi:hypothetical protein